MKLSHVVPLAGIATVILSVSGIAAMAQQGGSGKPASEKPSPATVHQHQHDMMDMSAMKQEPHHVLAMAYKDNLVTFCTALRNHANEAKQVNTEFARAAVAEMKRSFDKMQQHHSDHMKTMDDKMKAQMADRMKQMDAHHASIQEDLAALDKEVNNSAPDAKSISKYSSDLLKQCDAMSAMHGASMEHKMAQPKDQKPK